MWDYLLSGQQRDGWDAIGILVAFRYGHLFEEIYLLLACEEYDFVVTEHHDGVCQLVAKQPSLQKSKNDGNSLFPSMHFLQIQLPNTEVEMCSVLTWMAVDLAYTISSSTPTDTTMASILPNSSSPFCKTNTRRRYML